jgi:hypothetical protein
VKEISHLADFDVDESIILNRAGTSNGSPRDTSLTEPYGLRTSCHTSRITRIFIRYCNGRKFCPHYSASQELGGIHTNRKVISHASSYYVDLGRIQVAHDKNQ